MRKQAPIFIDERQLSLMLTFLIFFKKYNCSFICFQNQERFLYIFKIAKFFLYVQNLKMSKYLFSNFFYNSELKKIPIVTEYKI